MSTPVATLSEIRDGLQQRLLTHLYRGAESSNLVLKGGAAMRVLTASARYTQGSGLSQVAISEPKQTDTVARWKITGCTSAGESLHLTVEVSRRRAPDLGHVIKVPVQIADRTLPRVYVSVYDEQARADNKLRALLDENRTASRDIYDLELLLARGVHPSTEVVENVGGHATLVLRVSEKLDLMGWALFRDQVLPALPREIQANLDEEEYLSMKVRLLDLLERSLAGQVSDKGRT